MLPGAARRLDAAVFLAGAALMGLEIVGSRVLAPVFGTSLFVWGALITTFLAALALGYAFGGRLADRRPDPAILASLLACSGILLVLVFASPQVLLAALGRAAIPERFRPLVAAAILFGPPSVLMGMVTPFAVRLAAKEIATVGSASGRLSALSTSGSILGTFATAFFLIPAFATRPILFGLGATLLIASLLVPAPRTAGRLAIVSLLAVGATGTFLAVSSGDPSLEPAGKVVYEKETAYHHLRVVDGGIRRSLYFDNRTQGYIAVRPGLVLPRTYTDGMMLALVFPVRPVKTAVMIGLGAGMVPTLLSERAPEIATTSIEIDPEVVETARRFFRFAPPANSRVLVGDGRRELDRQVPGADVVFVDAYFADSLPFHLVTKEFFELCHRKLSSDGVLAMNFGGNLTGRRNALFWAAVKTVRLVFPRTYIFSSELASGRATFVGNAMLIATRSPDRLDKATIADRAAVLAERLARPPVTAWAADLYEGELKVGDVPVLTDAYAPTDALQNLSR
ncbi:MAG: fused MFS/spermidine synthase [Thermoanaerobaculia bacterium]